jgi:site-specific DNA-methyltransferase (adenine-specific)
MTAPLSASRHGASKDWPGQLEGVFLDDNLRALRSLPDACVDLVYIDPPFGTQQVRKLGSIRTGAGTKARKGFAGRLYQFEVVSNYSYSDDMALPEYLSFLYERLAEIHRVLSPTGSVYLHLDFHAAHYARLLLDELFGPERFLNEIIWAYDYGARSKRRWPSKHDTIHVYVKNPDGYYFDAEGVDREPYMAPGLVTAEKAAKGKLPTDVWWHTIVPTNGREKTGYPTQKPEGIVRRMVQASTREGDWCLDFFAGSGTLGAVAAKLGRHFVLIDSSPKAYDVMLQRLGAELHTGALRAIG